MNTESYLGPMEKQLSSSEFSSYLQHCRFSRRFKTNWKLVRQVQKTLKIESSSCPCSMILIGQRTFQRMSFEFRKRSRITQTDFLLDIGHSSVQETKTNRTERTPTNLKESMTADVMVENVKESVHPKVRGTGALNRGFLKRKGGRCIQCIIGTSGTGKEGTTERLVVPGADDRSLCFSQHGDTTLISKINPMSLVRC